MQDVDKFVSSLEQIRRNLALHYLLTNGSTAVNGSTELNVLQEGVLTFSKVLHV